MTPTTAATIQTEGCVTPPPLEAASPRREARRPRPRPGPPRDQARRRASRASPSSPASPRRRASASSAIRRPSSSPASSSAASAEASDGAAGHLGLDAPLARNERSARAMSTATARRRAARDSEQRPADRGRASDRDELGHLIALGRAERERARADVGALLCRQPCRERHAGPRERERHDVAVTGRVAHEPDRKVDRTLGSLPEGTRPVDALQRVAVVEDRHRAPVDLLDGRPADLPEGPEEGAHVDRAGIDPGRVDPQREVGDEAIAC